MKPATFATVAVLGGTLAASFVLGPSGTRGTPSSSLPNTGATYVAIAGSMAPITRIRHGVELEPPATPTEIYEQFVPPPPTPAPTPAPRPAPAHVAAAAPRPYVAPAGYITNPVPIYRQ